MAITSIGIPYVEADDPRCLLTCASLIPSPLWTVRLGARKLALASQGAVIIGARTALPKQKQPQQTSQNKLNFDTELRTSLRM